MSWDTSRDGDTWKISQKRIPQFTGIHLALKVAFGKGRKQSLIHTWLLLRQADAEAGCRAVRHTRVGHSPLGMWPNNLCSRHCESFASSWYPLPPVTHRSFHLRKTHMQIVPSTTKVQLFFGSTKVQNDKHLVETSLWILNCGLFLGYWLAASYLLLTLGRDTELKLPAATQPGGSWLNNWNSAD